MKSFLIVLTFAILNRAQCINECDVDGVDENLVHQCCKHPDSHDNIVQTCATKTGNEVINSHKDPFLDATSDEVISNTCFAECLFKQYNFIKHGALDMVAVRKHYMNATDEVYSAAMIDAFEHCHSQVEDKLSAFVANDIFQTNGVKQCNPKASVTWACVVREFFHNCPDQRWSNTEQCQRLLTFSKNCKTALP